MAELTHPIQEAERYLQNARTILSEKAEKVGSYYNDSKYVKLAGHAAWCGVLIALDAALNLKVNLKRGQRIDIKDYQEAIGKKDSKMTKPLKNAYDLLHKSLSYDGITNYAVVQNSLNEAKYIINWAGKNYKPARADL